MLQFQLEHASISAVIKLHRNLVFQKFLNIPKGNEFVVLTSIKDNYSVDNCRKSVLKSQVEHTSVSGFDTLDRNLSILSEDIECK